MSTEQAPDEQALDGRAAFTAAVLELIGGACHSLALYWPDPRECGLESPAGEAALKAMLLRAPRQVALRWLLRDGETPARHMPRITRTLMVLEHKIALRVVADPDDPALAQAMLIADCRHLVLRLHPAAWQGRINRNDPAAAAICLERFDRAWHRAHPAPGFTPLGL